jgi:hypothetical protein
MSKITLTMEGHEAILVHGRLTEAQATALARLAKATGDDRDAHHIEVGILSRVVAQLGEALYPRCQWLEECDGLAQPDSTYCKFHGQLVRESLARRAAA